jgi:hypothetical protein
MKPSRGEVKMSIAQFKDCPNCGEKMHISKKTCPKCGHRKKLRWFHWVLIGLALLVVFSVVRGGGNSSGTVTSTATADPAKKMTRTSEPVAPESQQKFMETVASHKKLFKDAKNELQQSSIRVKRRQALGDLRLGMRVNDWTGSIRRMETTSEGHAAIAVTIGPGIELCTWNNALSDIGSETLIRHGSPLYNLLSQLEKGQKIRFSGFFFPSEDDYYEECSITIEGSMSAPEFLFMFTEAISLK